MTAEQTTFPDEDHVIQSRGLEEAVYLQQFEWIYNRSIIYNLYLSDAVCAL